MIILTTLRIVHDVFTEAMAMYREMRQRHPYAFGED
jgi:hypothetical protein